MGYEIASRVPHRNENVLIDFWGCDKFRRAHISDRNFSNAVASVSTLKRMHVDCIGLPKLGPLPCNVASCHTKSIGNLEDKSVEGPAFEAHIDAISTLASHDATLQASVQTFVAGLTNQFMASLPEALPTGIAWGLFCATMPQYV